ncbi:hypothetical protein DFJ73DRAFT_634642 [Zopfochytrium polystomum]|nr:hypothetical protein DFJ73DRAFT_634642 [Zopfochytrium polystomum]
MTHSSSSSLPVASSIIPTIDLSFLRQPWHPNDAAVQAAAQQIRAACIGSGFFTIVNHTLRADVAARALQYSRRFFALPLEYKMELAVSRSATSGYLPSSYEDVELIHHLNLRSNGNNSLAQTFHTRLEGHPGFPEMNIGANVWPNHPSLPADFKETMIEYFNEVDQLSVSVMSLIALSLDLPVDFFKDFLESGLSASVLRCLNYRPSTAAGKQQGIGAHTDGDALTLIVQDHQGLQVSLAGGAFVDVPPVTVPPGSPPAVVCNLGDILHLLTNGVYQSTVHRTFKTARDRHSLAFFRAGGFDFEFEPLEACVRIGGGRKIFEGKMTPRKFVQSKYGYMN